MKAAADAGIPYAPWGFESRWQLAWIKTVDGDWDEALRLTDTSGEQVPPIPSALVESIALVVEAGRGEPVAERARALRRFWELEGGVVINSVVAEMADAAHEDDPTKVIAVYQDAVAVLSRIWHEWFSARIRLAAITIGAVADSLPRLSGAERTDLLAEVERLHGEGHTVLTKYSDPSGHWGPEGRAWTKRLDAETLRARWLAGIDAPPQEALVEVWREAEQFCSRSSATSTSSPRSAPSSPASCARPATPPRLASWATRPVRSRTGSAPSRCWSDCVSRAAPRPGPTVRRPTP